MERPKNISFTFTTLETKAKISLVKADFKTDTAENSCFIVLPNEALAPQYKGDKIPAVYFFHGASGSPESTCYMLDAPENFEKYQEAGRPLAVIFVPNMDQGPWLEKIFLEKLMPGLEEKLPIGGQRTARLISGVSQGGEIAGRFYRDYSNLFRGVAFHSGALAGIDIMPLVEAFKKAEHPLIWFDVGLQDPFLPIFEVLKGKLLENNLKFTYSTVTGGHSADYWNKRFPDYLRWYGTFLNTPE